MLQKHQQTVFPFMARLITCGTVDEETYCKHYLKNGLLPSRFGEGLQLHYMSQPACPFMYQSACTEQVGASHIACT